MKRLFPLLFLIFAVALNVASGQTRCTNATGTFRANPTTLSFGQVEIGSSSSKFVTIQNVSAQQAFMEVRNVTVQDSQFSFTLPKSLPICLGPTESFQIEVHFAPTSAGAVNSQLQIGSSAQSSPDFIGLSGEGTAPPIVLQVSPTSLDFGEVLIGKSSTKTFNIQNQGKGAATIDLVSSSNNAFAVLTAFPKTIGIGGQAQVKVMFAPTKVGSVSGTLSVKSGGQTAATVGVTGSGKRGNPDINLPAQRLDFGSLDIGTFRDRNLVISNMGDAELEVTPEPGAHVMVSPPGPLAIGPGKSAQVIVRFIADASGTISKPLRLMSNDPDEEEVEVNLNAMGTQGKLGLLDITQKSNVGKNSNDTTGVQWVDYNGDGKEDVYLTGHNGNFLFKNLGGGKFANVTVRSKLGNSGKDSRGASWADADNDGDPDVFIANFNGPSAVMKNNKGVFANQGGALGLFSADNTPGSQGGIWLDFNNDGRLDVFVIKDGRPNELFKQTGLFRFVDVASSAGVALNSAGRSAVAADFNNDGYQDLYVANFNHPNKLYINKKNETFVDMTQSAGVGFTGASQAVTATDYDGDGDLDLFVANGNGGSVLYRNNGHLKFRNVTAAAGLSGPKGTTGATFSDFDNDGDQDLLIVQATGGNVLYRNVGKGRFVKSANIDVTSPANSSSSSAGDSNNDGTPDVIVGGSDGSGDSLYDNTGGSDNNWLVLILQGSVSNRSAIGAKVVVRAGVMLQAKVVTAGNGQSQDSLPLEFGLGKLTRASIIVAWPNGNVQTLDNIAANQKLKIAEPAN